MQVKDCIVSAPGKAILHGEHAVVHGKVALAVSLNLRTYLRLKATNSGKVCINLPNIDTFLCWDLSELKRLIPYSYGKREEVKLLDTELVRRLRDFVGVTNGNLDTCNMATLAFLYIYLSLFGPGELPSLTVSVWSELPTGAGLGSSAAYSFPSIMTPVLDSVDAISCTCEKVLSEMTCEPITGEHYNILEELIDINQHHLNVMGVGHPALDTLCQVTLARGLHSKLTGAGGGGCGITLLRPETDSFVVQSTVQDLKDRGFDCWETSIGGPGVQQHSPLSVKEDILEILNHY
eukprot:superscaffoldBa00000975_g8295